jgi:hypothetical protein
MDIIGPIIKTYFISVIDYFLKRGFAKVISSRAVKHCQATAFLSYSAFAGNDRLAANSLVSACHSDIIRFDKGDQITGETYGFTSTLKTM